MTQIQVKIPELLHEALQHYLEVTPRFTLDEVATLGLCLFLLQQDRSAGSRALARNYLDTLFQR